VTALVTRDRTENDVLLTTDLHAGNVLAAQREPWLVIDPKPFVGDVAYNATQRLLNCKPRVLANLASSWPSSISQRATCARPTDACSSSSRCHRA
jgi:streptomycin 6-kinase